MPVHLLHRVRQERGGGPRLAMLDHVDQHRCYGHAEVQDSAGLVFLFAYLSLCLSHHLLINIVTRVQDTIT